MSNRETCWGCEGKGWVMILMNERTSPFISRDRMNPAPPDSVMVTREYDTRECPICRGDGIASRKATTIGEAAAAK